MGQRLARGQFFAEERRTTFDSVFMQQVYKITEQFQNSPFCSNISVGQEMLANDGLTIITSAPRSRPGGGVVVTWQATRKSKIKVCCLCSTF